MALTASLDVVSWDFRIISDSQHIPSPEVTREERENMTIKELCETCANMGVGKVCLFNSYDGHQAYLGDYEKIKHMAEKFGVMAWRLEECKNLDIDFVLYMTVELNIKGED